jgi:hypothetical protein
MTRRILVLVAVVLPILFLVVPADAVAPLTVAGTIGHELDALAPPAAAYVVVAPDGTATVGTHGTGVTARTPFVLGSLSKSFTALSVMQLVDRGKVALDRPVTAYPPWFRTATPGRVPTIRQLLDQSSGLPTAAGVADVTHPGRGLEQRVRRIADVTPTAAPGARFQYCNLNFATLGLVVQTVSGQPYVLAGQPAPAIGFFDRYRNRYLVIDSVFVALIALMAGRWVVLIRRPRTRGARRAALGLAGSIVAAGLVYVTVVYGLGRLFGFALQPDLMLGGVPELLVLMVLLAAYPILTSVLRTAVARPSTLTR